MKRNSRVQALLALLLGALLCWGGVGLGCNPMFEQSLGRSSFTPTAPGGSDFVLVRFLNSANVPPGTGISFLASYRIGGGLPVSISGVGVSGQGLVQGQDMGQLVPCTMTVLTLGDTDDLDRPGAWLVHNPPLDPVEQPLEPLGELLQNGVHFRCGDTVTFVAFADPDAPAGFRVTWQVQSGMDQTGPFEGPDPFDNLEKEIEDHEDFFGVDTGF